MLRRIALGWALALALVVPAYAAQAVVHAVLFYSPTCPHCHTVITESLPPLMEQYGEQLQIVGVDASTPSGQELYNAAVARYRIPRERLGVPMLVIGETILVGSLEIPQQLPGLIDAGLQRGGIPWPDIPGLAAQLPTEATPASATPIPQMPSASIAATEVAPIMRDMPANALAVGVLFGMIVTVFWAIRAWRNPRPAAESWRNRAVPLLALCGLGIAGYLALVETAQAPAVCGPLGNCAAVQQSAYARIMGVPIGLIGMAGYIAILLAWGSEHVLRGDAARLAGKLMAAMIGLGTIFSIYLTFLEPFVIGATCAWCLTSAVLMTALLWITAPYHGYLVAAPQRTARGHR